MNTIFEEKLDMWSKQAWSFAKSDVTAPGLGDQRYRNLVSAVIYRALADLSIASSRRESIDQRALSGWFWPNQDDDGPFSLRWCCEVLSDECGDTLMRSIQGEAGKVRDNHRSPIRYQRHGGDKIRR